jgi:class 3 adenylate cyclase/tetratricopeptide (TPR) repeat protein
MQCPRCQTENREGRRFCSKCAAPLAVVCASCGFTNDPGDEFCGGCAQSLRAGTPMPARFQSPEGYTPKHLVEKILTSRSALEGERKQVTVLFADMKGSMELLAGRDPEEARKILDPVLERMMEAVHHYEGTVNQVMGDGIMALFGAPLAHEDHAIRGCYAALRIQEAIERYAREVQRTHGVPIHVRVGLNSGEVVVRTIGSDLHMDYSAIGQTTHLAARMEQMAMPGSVLMSAATLRLAEGYVQVKPLGPMSVKGLTAPVEVYEVTGRGAARTRLQAAVGRGGLAQFVGRDAEIEQLRRAHAQAAGGHGQVVGVVGEPGVGKSRLFHEFTHSHRLHGWLTLEGGSVSYGKATAYLPVIDLLKAYYQIEPHDDPRRVREKVGGKLIALDEALTQTLPAFLALLDVPADNPQWQALDPPQRRERMLESVKRLLLRESQVQPLLLVFEDLHWIDSETQALLDSLVESLPTARVLLLVNYRPEYEHAWGRKTYYTQLRIDPLPPESASELLQALLGLDAALEPLKRLLVERTAGNPFFLEESVQALVETRALAGERGAYRLAGGVEAIQMPPTVHAVLAARIDRLPSEEKRLLQSAAVIGKDVPFAILEAIAEASGEELRRDLSHLQTTEFLYETTLFPHPEYTFKHALTHEVAYGSLLQDRRRALHVKTLDAIEGQRGRQLSRHAELLAHHALQGEDWPRAARYAYVAGERAIAQARYAAAGAFFDGAIRALDRQGEGADLALKLDACLELWVARVETAQTEGFAELAEQADSLCRTLGDRQRLAQLRVRQAQGSWNIWCGPGGLETAVERAREAFDLADPTDLRTRSYARFVAGAASLASGRFRDAIRELEAGVELFAAAPIDVEARGLVLPIRANLRTWQAEAHATLGEFAPALALFAEARQIAKEIDHPQCRWLADACWGYVLVTKGEIDAAARTYASGLAAEKINDLSYKAALALSLGVAYCHFLLGRRDEGLRALPRDRTLFESAGPWRRTVIRYGALTASAYLAAGLQDEAQEALAEGLALATADNARAYQVALGRLQAEALVARGVDGRDEAIRCYRRSLALAEELGMRPELARCHHGLGTLLRREGAVDEARAPLTTAATMYREMDMPFWLAQVDAEVRQP